MRKGKKQLPMDIVMLDIMKEYGRSYNDYMDTPAHLIEIIIEKRNIDARFSKLQGGNGQ